MRERCAIRPQSGSSCSAVQQALIPSRKHSEKPGKYKVSGLFPCPKLFDLFSQILTKSDRKKVVNTEGTALFRALLARIIHRLLGKRGKTALLLHLQLHTAFTFRVKSLNGLMPPVYRSLNIQKGPQLC